MASDEEKVQNALYAVHSRLAVIEGKVNLVARAERRHLLELLEAEVRADPFIAQIYLLLDGAHTQKEVHAKLVEYGIDISQPTVSRRMALMETEHGIADLIRGGNTKIYGKDRAMEQVLNLTKNMRKWLTEEGHVVPEQPARRRTKKAS
jgi:DNA-binding transcriptional ArsR family regulator